MSPLQLPIPYLLANTAYLSAQPQAPGRLF